MVVKLILTKLYQAFNKIKRIMEVKTACLFKIVPLKGKNELLLYQLACCWYFDDYDTSFLGGECQLPPSPPALDSFTKTIESGKT